MPPLLFLDPATGERITYDELLTSVRGEAVAHSPHLRPTSPGAAVLGLLRAVALGRPLTLFDTDFSSQEVEHLGGTETDFALQENVPGIEAADILTLIASSRLREGFRLTLFTSGSTGLPKRVTHDLQGLTRALRVGANHAANVWGLAYNPTHIAGVQVILQAFFNGNPLIHLFGAGRIEALGTIAQYGITHISATPSFYRLLLPVEAPLDGVRAVALGGERGDESLLRNVARLFPSARIRNLYASTEAGTLLVADGDTFEIPDSLADRLRVREGQLEVHRSLLGEMAAQDPAEKPETGCLRAEAGDLKPAPSDSSSLSALGPQLSALTSHLSALLPPLSDAWYRTGDMTEIVAENPLRFRFVGRDRDWVNVGGHKVNPSEVETAMLGLPDVREVRVYGRTNSVLGQILCAEVVADPAFDEARARAWLAERLQPAKIPRLIKRVPSLPRARTGKLQRS